MNGVSVIADAKHSNRQQILNLLRGQNLLSRTQMAQKTGLSKATITRLLNEMIRDGLVEEVRTTESGVGRPHVLLRLASRTRCAIGVELTPALARITLTDMNARPLKQRIQMVYKQDIDHILDALAEEIRMISQDVLPEQLVGVGVAVPGMVDSATGVVSLDPSAGWPEVSLARLLTSRLGQPVFIANQAHAAAWGEKWYGKFGSIDDLLYVRLGTIVEAGVVLAGRLHTGKMLTAGAIGHMTYDPQGSQCFCGNHGCLNTVASATALLANTRTRLKHNSSSMLMALVEGKPSFLTMEHMLLAMEAGDGLAVEMFAEAGRAVGVVVASLLNLLNFERVIIGGQLSAAGNVLLTPLRNEVSRRALPSSLVLGRIEMTSLEANAASIGAACLILQSPAITQNPRG